MRQIAVMMGMLPPGLTCFALEHLFLPPFSEAPFSCCFAVSPDTYPLAGLDFFIINQNSRYMGEPDLLPSSEHSSSCGSLGTFLPPEPLASDAASAQCTLLSMTPLHRHGHPELHAQGIRRVSCSGIWHLVSCSPQCRLHCLGIVLLRRQKL